MYTRYFVANYGDMHDCSLIARKLVEQLQTVQGPATQEHKSKILRGMQRIYQYKFFLSRNRKGLVLNEAQKRNVAPHLRKYIVAPRVEAVGRPPRFKYYLLNSTIDKGQDLPYMTVVDRPKNGRIPWWMMGKPREYNTIHGTLSTLGCWMIFCNDTPSVDHHARIKNYTYYEFLRQFAGLQYNAKKPEHSGNNIFVTTNDKNSWECKNGDNSLDFGENIFKQKFASNTAWSAVYFFARKNRWTKTDSANDTEEFVLL
jgi:hypothetical protein